MRRKELIKEIIVSFQRRELPHIVERELKLPLDTGKIITVTGVRRSGKTYLLYQTIGELKKKVSPESIVYFNFEDERLELKSEELNLIVEAYRELYPDKKLSEVYFFFDEIQNVEGWERFIRRIYDTETKNIYLTGSNSKLLSSEIATALRGRTLKYELYPLSYREFLKFKGLDLKPTDVYLPELRSNAKKLFEEFLYWGGFPEVAYFEDDELRLKTLQEYFDVMVYRDLVERFNFKNLPVVKYFLKRCIESITSPLSVNNIYNELRSQGYKVSKDTLYSLLEAAESVYLLKLLKKFSRSTLKVELSQKKSYVIDNGLVNAITFSFLEDRGKLLENLIHRELLIRFRDIFYFKEKKECDFVAFKGKKVYPIQVSYTVEDERAFQREVEGLLEACKFLGEKEGLIHTYDEEKEVEMENIKILLLPAWKFLLGIQ